jgi:hypothetical protein
MLPSATLRLKFFEKERTLSERYRCRESLP